jgi:transposase-like protein
VQFEWRTEASVTRRSRFRVAGKWTYSYCAVDSSGDAIDFMLSPKRDAVAAKHFCT